MAFSKREKLLLGSVTGSLLVLLAAAYFVFGLGESLAKLRAQRDQLDREVKQKELKARPGVKAAAQMARWEKCSLPTNRELARSLYQKWLLELVVDQVKLRNATVDPADDQPHQGIYTALPFTIHGDGTLDQLVHFLFKFYSVGHLHKIRHLNINPIKDSPELSLVISIDALCLPGADRRDRLSAQLPKRLKLSELNDYVEKAVWRKMEGDRVVKSGGLFAPYAPYVPPAPPRIVRTERPDPPRPEPPRFDQAKYTYVNGIHEVDGRPEVWLFVRTTGETLKRREGEDFQIGSVRGTVVRINVAERDVEVELDGQRFLVPFGENLREGLELSDLGL